MSPKWLEEYRHALVSLNALALKQFYELPCQWLSQGQLEWAWQEEDLNHLIALSVQTLHQLKVDDIRVEQQRQQPCAQGHWLQLEWGFWSQGEEVTRFLATYLISHEGKIVSVTSY